MVLIDIGHNFPIGLVVESVLLFIFPPSNFFTNKWEFICFTLNWGFGSVFCLFVGCFSVCLGFLKYVSFFRDASFQFFCWEKLTITRFLADCLPDILFIPGLSLALVKDNFPHNHSEL